MKSYIISLKRENPRLSNELKKVGLDAEWVKGIRGDRLSKQKIKIGTTPLFGLFGPKSAIGCGLSHIKVWKKFLQDGSERCIVFEDDFILVENFQKKFWNANNCVPKDFDILFLGSFGSDLRSQPNYFSVAAKMMGMACEHKKVNSHIIQPTVTFGMHAYMLSREGAQKLVKLLDERLFYHIDYCLQYYYSRGMVNTYVLEERIAYQTSSDSNLDGPESTNCSSKHPFILNELGSKIFLDRHVTLNHQLNMSILRIHKTNLSIVSFILFLIGFAGGERTVLAPLVFAFLIGSYSSVVTKDYLEGMVTNYWMMLLGVLVGK